MTDTTASTRRGNQIGRFLAHVVAAYPLARWTLMLTFVLLVLEYATLSLMVPLSMGAGGDNNAGIVEVWSSIVFAIGLQPTLMTWVWLFLVLMALRSVAGYAHLCMTTLVSKQVHRELSKSVFGQIVFDEPMAQIYRRTIGFYISLAGDDTFRAGTLVNSALQFVAALVSVGAGLALLFRFSTLAFEVTLVFLLFAAIGIGFCARALVRLNGQAVDLSREARTSFMEALNSLRSIRSMSSEDFVHRNYSTQISDYTRLLFLIEVFKNGIRFVPAIVALLVGIAVLAPGRPDTLALDATVVFAATTILIRLFLSLGTLLNSGGALMIDGRAAKDLGLLIDLHRAPRVSRGLTDRSNRPALEGVELDRVHYAYGPSRAVLDNLCVGFQRGRCYSLVGPSGTGKSTLADLLLGLVAPNRGRILLNGGEVQSPQLRGRMILVEQQPRIFSVSVLENLTLGLNVSAAEVQAALEAVELNSFVQSLPKGLDTILDYQGANLSGGQRQRLSIARALLRRPEVLILDEATSALDAPTEKLVICSLKRAMRDGILVFITHDPEVAASADEIIDLQQLRPESAI